LKRQIDLLEAERENRKLNYDISLKVYEKVVAIDQSNPDDLRLAVALIEVLPDDSFKGRLGAALSALSSSVAKTTTMASLRPVAESVADTAQFIAESVKVAQVQAQGPGPLPGTLPSPLPVPPLSTSTTFSLGNPGGWDYDVFWCEKEPSEIERATAQEVATAITGANTGRVRVRMLPDAVNARPAYQVKGAVIRADSTEMEVAEAERLRDAIKAATGLTFTVEQNTGESPWYLSVFLCPG
ncbi:MAG: hypothetical protein NXI07_14740, partial [bacterium]|nr:hypothetical protein [bacterium]